MRVRIAMPGCLVLILVTGADGAGPRVPTFTDIAADTGLEFVHVTGATGEFYFAEIMGAGCALLDYDNDGDLDVYLLQGGPLGPQRARDAQRDALPGNRLFRNELIGGDDGGGVLRFTDVTEKSGTGDTGYAMGVATADYDGDGDVDLFVTNFGPDVLLRNDGDGTFTDVTAEAGIDDPRWTTSATFLDYDRDGRPDLFTVAYADFTVAANKACIRTRGLPDYCGPASYRALPARLYRNLGTGRFSDVSGETQIDRAYGHGLGVAAADLDGNGWVDVYVANDGDENQLWINDRGHFRNAGLLSGAALNYSGKPEAGMGVAINDFDGDADPDIFLTHLFGESNTLYENIGRGLFEDRTPASGLGQASRPWTGFGVAAADVDHDADLDLMIVNGGVKAMDSLAGDPYPYHQPNQLFIQDGDGNFRDASGDAGGAFERSEVSRGLAAGDVDNDGDIDFLISNNHGPARLLRNGLAGKSAWMSLRVLDARTGGDVLGAVALVALSDGRILRRPVGSGGSYCSASDPRVHVAWPDHLRLRSVEIRTPDGATHPVSAAAPGRHLTVRIDTETGP